MAYLDLHQHFDVATAQPVRASVSVPVTTSLFERSEWQVIMLAQKEGLNSLSEPGRLTLWLTRVFGLSAIRRRLANPRLEALRRFSVLAWHYSYALPVSAIASLRAAGFSEAQLDHALASIASARVRTGGLRRA